MKQIQGNRMQGRGSYTLPSMGWIPAADWRFDNYATRSTLRTADADWMQGVPVEPVTILGLELLLEEPSLDLQKASDLVLSDLGATLQVFRLAAREHGGLPKEFCEMQEILSSLPVEQWVAAVSAHSTSAYPNCTEIRAVWHHCRLVGQYAKLMSGSLEGVCSDLAYVAGLLHELETIPHVLDPHFGAATSSQLHVEDVVPEAVLAALQSARERGSASEWRYVLSSAHALAVATPRVPVHM